MLVPFIADPSDTDRLLLPDPSHRRVRQLEDDPEGRCWQFLGGQYDEAARFWLDDEGFLSRYQWHQDEQHSWDVRLFE